ncbi:MarR family winged helix-turn-helix transcriptional regulator [Streptomyces sp. NPDC052236]|uniref:MarR family winged helix-turn-helix transcriptional regulator n=1 Tax=Streptomyces sp. NPDC052236 TaxID=3365686 RepID=UPI0037D8C9C0
MTTTTPTTPAAPALNGPVIAQAHYATRAVMESWLARAGVTFHQALALNAIVANGAAIEQDRLVARLTSTARIDESFVLRTIADMTAAGLLEPQPGDELRLDLTDAGRSLQERIAKDIADAAGRLYVGFSDDELATASRVLTLVTARANAELG